MDWVLGKFLHPKGFPALAQLFRAVVESPFLRDLTDTSMWLLGTWECWDLMTLEAFSNPNTSMVLGPD